MSEGMLGVKSTMKVVDMGSGKMFAHIQIDGHPELGSCSVVQEGIANNVNLPHMGGKCVLTFNSTDKGYKSVIETQNMGTWTMDEEYTEEGIKSVISKDGKSVTECWKRVVCVDGLYKYKSNTGLAEYMKKSGYPEAVIANMDHYMMGIKVSDDGLRVYESWGEISNFFSAKFDVETTYKMPFEGMPDAKVVITHNGPGKFSWVMKTADGSAEEWKLHCYDEGMKTCGRNLKTGDSASVECYKETCPIIGKWKVASLSGAKEMYQFLGMPEAQAQEFINEIVELHVEEKGPMVRWNWKSKLQPVDLSFKWNEEVSLYDPFLKETTKNIATKCGNTMTTITKSSHGTWETKCIVGNTFMVLKSHLKGMESMTMTYIFMRTGM